MAIINQLFYESHIDNPDSFYRTDIFFGDSKNKKSTSIISGILNSPVPIAGANDFSSLKDSVESAPLGIGGAASKFNNGTKAFLRPFGKATVFDLYQTRKVWQESQVPRFSLELTFWGLKSGENRPIDKVKKLYSALLPSREKNGLLTAAPLNYKFTENTTEEATGTLSLTIGKWLRINSLLVATSANFTPSLQVMSDGSPLFMTGTVELEPYRMITYEEFLAWFPVTSARPPHIQNRNSSEKTSESDSSNFNDISNPLGRTDIIA